MQLTQNNKFKMIINFIINQNNEAFKANLEIIRFSLNRYKKKSSIYFKLNK
jgi:hypothetical protein